MLAIVQSLLSPAVGFFVLGWIATTLRSDLRIPEQAGQALALYLMVAIGFRGGVELRAEGLTPVLALAIPASLVLACCLALVAYTLLRRTRAVGDVDAAAIAAHYGSVSVVTFTVAITFLEDRGIGFEGFMPVLLALMEAPAIVIAVVLAARAGTATTQAGGTSTALRHAVGNGTVLLLMGALAIGLVTGADGMQKLEGALVAPFYGAVALFLLDMGVRAGERFADFKALPRRVMAFGAYMPVIGIVAGSIVGAAIGLSFGGTVLLAVLAGSASYIAAPAAMRIALPEASPGISLPLALGVTFPFNVALGIPFAYLFAALLHGGAA